MTPEYKNLRQFFGGYFHQDWDLDGGSDAAVVELFVRDSSPEILQATVSEVDELIRQCSLGEVDAQSALTNLWCFYYYQADDLSGIEWLKRLRDLLLSIPPSSVTSQMHQKFHLTKEDSADIGFATSCLIIGAITFSEFKNWLYFVIEHSDEVPNYFFNVLDVQEKFDFTLKVSDYLGFWAAWDSSDQEDDALSGIAFKRFRDYRSDARRKEDALTALAENPHVEDRFRAVFPFIEW